ncbi:DUF262 domain-containing protein [Flavobacterium sp. IB48]|uniref:DUF262 domain-containing protein n=1 Tax=Flavobacterium sp. IB48 TaxID=2779375 RepID=UPI0018E8AEEB|nr:DUF262 domain-containing protein [Flavobacterium sp. IB48]MBJ2124488.1 DUF262 domain-containing protein [Flavobacterium sp. IB48]
MAIEVTGKQIASDKITIKDVFGEDMWFTIPDYQRPYVWGEDQISNLLDDVSHSAVNTPDSQYFLGSLVLHCEPKNLRGTAYQENSVLDGQQRLTTLYILQAVIRDITTSETRKSTCAKAIFQQGNPDDGIPERLRIEFAIRKEVENFINKFIKENGGTLKKDELEDVVKTSKDVSIRNMANAILIINKWFADEDNLDIDTFFPYLRQYVILVYVASSELEDAFRLFTVLNDRGIKLRNSDILKAQNLKEVSTEQKQTKYAKFWEELEGELGEDFDLFLSYIRTILVKEKARNNLLKEFEDNIYHPKKFNHSTKKYEKAPALLKKGDDTFELIKAYKVHYDVIFSGNNHHISNNWAFDNLISVLNDTALSDIWIPPLLVYRHNFGDYKILDFLKLLDNKFSGDWIGRETPTTRIEAMNNIIKKVEELANEKEKSKDEKLNELFNDNVFKFNTSFFLSDLDENSIYGRRFARYKLRKVDFLLDAPLYSEKRSSYNEMTVEHILPQNPEDGSQWTKDFNLDEREEWTHKLGNLVLISRRKNSGQGRLDFTDKKAKYFTSSIETFPNSIRVMQKPQWTIKELKENHSQLINKIKLHYNI